MRLLALPLTFFLAVPLSGPGPVAPAFSARAELPPIRLPILFAMEPQQRTSVPPSGRSGYYQPVQPQTYHRTCGTVATDVCEVQVRVPPGATGEQVYQMGKQAEAAGRKGEALGYLHQSAERGYATAEGAYGLALLTGKGAMRDAQAGVLWLEKSAAQGNRGAALELGVAFEDGQGIPVDAAKAIVYLNAAAAQRMSLAEYRLGLDYEIGRGVSHNRKAALDYLRRAAADGQSMAGNTANFLARSREPQFHSVAEIDFAMALPPKPLTGRQVSGRCGPSITITRVYETHAYCTDHPGCPYVWNGISATCPN